MKVLAWLLFQVALLGTWLHATHVPLLRRILKYPRRAIASARPALAAGACRSKYLRESISQQSKCSWLAGRCGCCFHQACLDCAPRHIPLVPHMVDRLIMLQTQPQPRR